MQFQINSDSKKPKADQPCGRLKTRRACCAIVAIKTKKFVSKPLVLNRQSALAFSSIRNNLFHFYTFKGGATSSEVKWCLKNINSKY